MSCFPLSCNIPIMFCFEVHEEVLTSKRKHKYLHLSLMKRQNVFSENANIFLSEKSLSAHLFQLTP